MSDVAELREELETALELAKLRGESADEATVVDWLLRLTKCVEALTPHWVPYHGMKVQSLVTESLDREVVVERGETGIVREDHNRWSVLVREGKTEFYYYKDELGMKKMRDTWRPFDG